jgi:hypothetical protein
MWMMLSRGAAGGTGVGLAAELLFSARFNDFGDDEAENLPAPTKSARTNK